MAIQATYRANKICYQDGKLIKKQDDLIVEQPLSLQISLYGDTGNVLYQQVYWLTLRTPGDDNKLIIGYLLSQGVVRELTDIINLECESAKAGDENSWHVTLKQHCISRLIQGQKVHVASASCGLCGSASIKALELTDPPKTSNTKHWLPPKKIFSYTKNLTQHQHLFRLTGGVHGAAIFNKQGDLVELCEDIGRHNALDKLLGFCFLKGNTASQCQVVVISSRASFDIMQKIVMAGVEVLIAVGAPSDMAVKTAQRFGVTLIGFVKHDSFNVYHDEARLKKS